MTLVKKQRPKVRTVNPDYRHRTVNDWMQYISQKLEQAKKEGRILEHSIKN